MEDTVDKYNLRQHFHGSVECIGAKWHHPIAKWGVHLKDIQTGVEYSRFASILISAVGPISYPRDVKFQGMEGFEGSMFHTARWNHSVNYKGKRVAVVGNGCSAAEVVPALAQDAASVKQYARSGQWYHERPNHRYTNVEKFLFQWVPLWQKAIRLGVFLEADEETNAYFPTPQGKKDRAKKEAESLEYLYAVAPKNTIRFLLPHFH